MNTKPAPRAYSSITLDYREPASLDSFRTRVLAAQAEQELLGNMLERIAQLEAALLPFAVTGMNIAQARMMLDANGKQKISAGGSWVSTLDSISCSATESIFYDAIDASGRARIELHMQQEFTKMQTAMAAADERDDHVDAGGKTH